MNEDIVLVLGDTHGNLNFIEEAIIRLMRPHGINLLHVVGDFGYWTHTPGGVRFLHDLNDMAHEDNILITFTDGNHENFDRLNVIPIDNDGWRRITPNIWHAPRGHTWTWGRTRFLSLGGANSIDGPDGPAWWKSRMGQGRGPVESGTPIWNGKTFTRLPNDIDLGNWWPQEDITKDDVTRALEAVQGLNIDVMFTHDCPQGVDLPGIQNYPKGDQNRTRVRTVMDDADPSLLVHGHYHLWNTSNLNGTQVVGLAHDGAKDGGQYMFIETNHDQPKAILPDW